MQGRSLCVLFLFVTCAGGAAAITLGLRSDAGAFPFLQELSTGSKLEWSSGRVAELLASSPAVRVSVRGVRFVHRWYTVVLDTGWRRECLRSTNALCATTAP
eukprot:1195220-Rhodomonas_salina.1